MLYVGVDPGANGGIAVIDADGQLVKAQRFDNWKVHGQLLSYLKTQDCLIALEEVHAFPGQGVNSMFSFGANFGGWKSLIEFIQLPTIMVRPKEWQKYMLGTFPKGQSKPRAFAYVTKRYPKYQWHKKRDEGIIDAICLALYIKDNH